MLDIPGYDQAAPLYQSPVSLVVRAHHIEDDIPVILKILKDDYPGARELARYRHEYSLLRLFESPRIIAPLDLIEYRKTLVLVLEDIGAHSLNSLMQQQPPSLEQLLRIARDVALALSELHARQIIHKDINPSNIVHNPASGQTKLIDFGIAAEVSPEHPQHDATNLLEGTLAYISPEQTGRMNRALDYRSDLYSLGVTLYELLSTQLPFTARNMRELVHAHLARHPRPLAELTPQLPPILGSLVARLMAKSAEARYQSAAGLARDLSECLQQLHAHARIADFPLGRHDQAEVFRLPQTLYGRERERAALLAAFERCVHEPGALEWVLISGYSGVGKTSLVHEIQQPLVHALGSFIEGKFDQYQRALPYSAIAQALGALIDSWLTEPDEQLAARRADILAAVGDLGGVLLELAPRLELIIGAQRPPPELSGLEAQNRFNLACRRLIGAAATASHPLVLFIDDLHWADLASLNLLAALLTDGEIRHLLLIGAYRDNEVTPSHPLALLIEQLRERGVTPTCIEIDTLSLAEVIALTGDALRRPSSSVAGLATLIHRKTLGNPFFVNQCLTTFHAEGLIRYTASRAGWSCNLAAIERRDITENVVELMAAKIRVLNPDTGHTLERAACIGSRFDQHTLSRVSRLQAQALEEALEDGVRQGLLIRDGEWRYRFSHDRIQQAAYSLIPEAERAARHLEIGRLLLRDQATPGEAGAHLFAIADQLNAGRALITDPAEQLELVRLDLDAALKAKSAAAHSSAISYLRAAVSLLPPDPWCSEQGLTFRVFSELALCLCFAGETAEIEPLFALLLEQAHSPQQQVQVHRIRMEHYHLQGEYTRAVAIQIETLRLLGVEVPETPDALQALLNRELEQVPVLLGARSIEQLVDAAPMHSQHHQLIMDILMSLWTSAYLDARQMLVAWASCRMSNLSLEHGNNHLTSYAYMNYGFVCVALLGEYERGHRFGQVAIQLSDRYDDLLLRGKVYLLFAVFVNHWRAPLISSLEYSRTAFPLLVESGDWTYAGYCAEFMISDPMICAHPCQPLHEQAQRYLPFLKTNAPVVLDSFYRPACLNPLLHLMGLTRDETTFDDADFSESAFLDTYQNDALALSYFYTAKLRALYWFGQLDAAFAMLEKADVVAGVALAQAKVPEIYFFASLTMLARHHQLSPEDQTLYRSRVETYQQQMARWAEVSPGNFRHKHTLVEAERARVDGAWWRALTLYEQAIEEAREAGYLNNAALAYERLACLYLDQGLERAAATPMREARYLWRTWGARAKVRQLEREYGALLTQTWDDEHTREAPITDTIQLSDSSAALDVATIVEASQSLASEIQLEGLLNRMMAIIMAHAGADRCVLITARDSRLWLQAERHTDQAQVARLEEALDIEQAADRLPLTLIHYCARTREQVMLASAHAEGDYRRDPYVVATAMQSVLCTPLLLRGELSGLLYVENSLTCEAFSDKLVRILELLSTQVAISIQNADFYQRLETQVAERTEALSQVNRRLQHVNAELHRLSTIDGLTQLANRRHLDERLEDEWERHHRQQRSLGILICDVDHFKQYNDTYGHPKGDTCLIAIAQALTASASRSNDLVARYGGEEMVIVLPDTDEAGVQAVINKIRTNIEALGIPHAASSVSEHVTLSIGAYSGRPSSGKLSAALSIADQCLYAAKEGGRNRAVVNAPPGDHG